VLEWNDAGEATVIEHITHIHHLTLSDRVGEYDNKCCDGCLLPISDSFYYCTQCDFFLHKVCVQLPKVKQVWHHRCQSSLVLTSNEVFRCVACGYLSKAFAYKCEECKKRTCLRCVIARTPGAHTCEGHKHPVFLYNEYRGGCVACGKHNIKGLLRCKDCDFSLDYKCFSLPITSQHKSDEHLLSLTYHDDNSYSESYFCDVCEERRDPNLWFYHCAICDTSAHVKCVLGRHPFFKPGNIIKVRKDIHEHPLTVVKKIYYYPNCGKCGGAEVTILQNYHFSFAENTELEFPTVREACFELENDCLLIIQTIRVNWGFGDGKIGISLVAVGRKQEGIPREEEGREGGIYFVGLRVAPWIKRLKMIRGV
ncbi:hypothetical protein Gotur_008187, partial [Gossypium turneri]